MGKSLSCSWACAMLAVSGMMVTFAMNYGLLTGMRRMLYGKPHPNNEDPEALVKTGIAFSLTIAVFVVTFEQRK